jgi:hypothetical protein
MIHIIELPVSSEENKTFLSLSEHFIQTLPHSKDVQFMESTSLTQFHITETILGPDSQEATTYY